MIITIKSSNVIPFSPFPQPPPICLAVSVALLVLAVYLSTLAPSITWRNGGADSGELAAAVATLGIAHPPGYPAYTLLGWAWANLPLGGDVAYRLNLLSAVGAALASGLSVMIVITLTARFPDWARAAGGVTGGLLLGLAPLTWSQATITEVYAPGLALLSLFTWLVLSRKSEPMPLTWGLIGFTAGFSLGVLPQLALAFPGGLAVLLLGSLPTYKQKQALLRPGLFSLLVGFGVGLGVFSYLPLRALTHPPANWGAPDTWARFWALVTAAQYHHLASWPTTVEWGPRLFQNINQSAQQLSLIGLVLALAGIRALWLTHRSGLIYLLGLTSLTWLFSASYPVEGSVVYLLPALLGLALCAGTGGAWLIAALYRRVGRAGAGLLAIALLLAIGWRTAILYPRLNISDDQQAATFGLGTLAGLPPNAIIVSNRDETTFSLWYRQAAGDRPDVVVIDNRLLFYDWYQHNLAQRYPDLAAEQLAPGRVTSNHRPVYLLDALPGAEISPVVISVSN